MTRTQIYLTPAEVRALDRASHESGRTKSQLIREAIDRAFLSSSGVAAAMRALEGSAGAWRRRETGKAYVERVRRGVLEQRLKRAGR